MDCCFRDIGALAGGFCLLDYPLAAPDSASDSAIYYFSRQPRTVKWTSGAGPAPENGWPGSQEELAEKTSFNLARGQAFPRNRLHRPRVASVLLKPPGDLQHRELRKLRCLHHRLDRRRVKRSSSSGRNFRRPKPRAFHGARFPATIRGAGPNGAIITIIFVIFSGGFALPVPLRD